MNLKQVTDSFSTIVQRQFYNIIYIKLFTTSRTWSVCLGNFNQALHTINSVRALAFCRCTICVIERHPTDLALFHVSNFILQTPDMIQQGWVSVLDTVLISLTEQFIDLIKFAVFLPQGFITQKYEIQKLNELFLESVNLDQCFVVQLT